MICKVTLGDINKKFGGQLLKLTNMELDALAYLCKIFKEEEE